MARHITRGAISIGLAVLSGCADPPAAPASPARARIPDGVSRADYPVDGNGNPDQSQAASISSATVSLGLSNHQEAGGLFEAVMAVEGFFNRAQITGSFEIKKGGQTIVSKSYDSGEGSPAWVGVGVVRFDRHPYWPWTFTCGTTATGSTTNRVKWYAQIPPMPAITWGDDEESAVAQPASPPSSACVTPTVAISPSPYVEVQEGVLQQFTTTT